MASESIGVERSWQEVLALLEAFCDYSDLTVDQVAANSLGYPLIPIPEVKEKEGRFRLAPKNINIELLGHPIYWIDPQLTKREEGESKEQWGIRMFYLILAFGLWDENYRPVDFLMMNGFEEEFSSTSVSPANAYHSSSFIHCFADEPKFALLTRDDMVIPYEEYEENAAKAIALIENLRDDDNTEYQRKLDNAVGVIASVLGEEGVHASDPANGFWGQAEPRISSLLTEYRSLSDDFSKDSVPVEIELEELAAAIRVQVVSMNAATSTLTIPTLHVMGLSDVMKDSMTRMLSDRNVKLLNNPSFDYQSRLQQAFAHVSWREAFEIFQDSWSDYEKAWKRARLAFANFLIQKEVAAGEKEFYKGYEELVAALDHKKNNLDLVSSVVSENSHGDISALDDYFADDEYPATNQEEAVVVNEQDAESDDDEAQQESRKAWSSLPEGGEEEPGGETELSKALSKILEEMNNEDQA